MLSTLRAAMESKNMLPETVKINRPQMYTLISETVNILNQTVLKGTTYKATKHNNGLYIEDAELNIKDKIDLRFQQTRVLGIYHQDNTPPLTTVINYPNNNDLDEVAVIIIKELRSTLRRELPKEVWRSTCSTIFKDSESRLQQRN